MTNSLDNVTNVYAKCRMQNEKETWICFSFFSIILAWIDGKLPLISQNYKGMSRLRNSWFVAKRCFQKWPEFALHLLFVVGHTTLFFRCFKLVILLAHLFSSLERRSPKSNKSFFTVKPPISNSNKVVAYENQTIGAIPKRSLNPGEGYSPIKVTGVLVVHFRGLILWIGSA